MLPLVIFAFFVAQLGCISLSLAESYARVPYVGYTIDGGAYQGMVGTVVGSTGDHTTYTMACPSPTKRSCPLYSGIALTVVGGPSRFELTRSSSPTYQRTACALAGSPSATAATCTVTETISLSSGPHQEETTTFTAPNTYNLKFVYYATLTVVGTTTVPVTTTATATSAASTRGGRNVTSSTITHATSTTASQSTSTSNAAKKTAAPLILMGGAFAGAAWAL